MFFSCMLTKPMCTQHAALPRPQIESPEDCRILAQLWDSQQEKSASVDVPTVLNTYNELRLPDAHAVCAMSEEAIGGARPFRPIIAAQMMLMTFLHKRFGKVAPKVIKTA